MRRAGFLAAVPLLAASVAPAHAQSAPTVTVLAPPIDPGSQAFYAADQGFFAKAGLQAHVGIAENGAAVAAAVAGGSADIGQANLVSLALAHERGLPFVAIAAANIVDWRQHQNALVVAPASPIRAARDLVGKTVALPGIRNITEVALDAWLEANGVSPKGVNVIDMPMSSMTAALASGHIDAGQMTFPELADGLEKRTIRVLSYPMEAIGKVFLAGAWFTTQNWAREHPDLVRRFAAAMTMAADWANAHPDLSAKVLQQVTGIPIAPGTPRVLFGRTLDAAALAPVIDASAKYGLLKTAFPARELLAAGS